MHAHVGDPGEEMINIMFVKYFACGSFVFNIFNFFSKDFIYLFERERDHRGRGRSRFLAEQGA